MKISQLAIFDDDVVLFVKFAVPKRNLIDLKTWITHKKTATF